MSELKKSIEQICAQKIIGKPTFRWVKEDLACIDYSNFYIAFDIFLGVDNIAVDLVLRVGASKERLIDLYPSIATNHKCRIATINKNLYEQTLAAIINSEYQKIFSKLATVDKTKIDIHRPLFYLNDTQELCSSEPIKMYFADGIANFGDFIGPWLASRLTKKPIINVRGLPASEGAIFGVGSIVSSINVRHQKCKIWGSGLIDNTNISRVMRNLRNANIAKISSVRGKVTEQYLIDNDFKVTPIYGDPALIFSELYLPPQVNLNSKRVIIPHYKHYQLFKSLNLEDFHIVNVADGVVGVIDQISNADLVISTSMHGLILAQSYGIPWVHLHLSDGLLLIGDDFKFKDFFTVLNLDQISQYSISLSELSKEVLDSVSNKASLPQYDRCYNSQAIIDALFECLM